MGQERFMQDDSGLPSRVATDPASAPTGKIVRDFAGKERFVPDTPDGPARDKAHIARLEQELQMVLSRAETAEAALSAARAEVTDAKDAEIKRLRDVLDLYREAVRVDVKMEGPRFMGANSSALKRAWDADAAIRAAMEGK
jgi:hypothetical protein